MRYNEKGRRDSMDLLLALGLPIILLLGATFLLAEGKLKMPAKLFRVSQNNALFWNIMIGISIAVAAIKFASSN